MDFDRRCRSHEFLRFGLNGILVFPLNRPAENDDCQVRIVRGFGLAEGREAERVDRQAEHVAFGTEARMQDALVRIHASVDVFACLESERIGGDELAEMQDLVLFR